VPNVDHILENMRDLYYTKSSDYNDEISVKLATQKAHSLVSLHKIYSFFVLLFVLCTKCTKGWKRSDAKSFRLHRLLILLRH
jgi:hypothetical protein